jgi:hypothetical protein
MLNLSFDMDLTRRRMGTSIFLLMLVARPKTKMIPGRKEVEYQLDFS